MLLTQAHSGKAAVIHVFCQPVAACVAPAGNVVNATNRSGFAIPIFPGRPCRGPFGQSLPNAGNRLCASGVLFGVPGRCPPGIYQDVEVNPRCLLCRQRFLIANIAVFGRPLRLQRIHSALLKNQSKKCFALQQNPKNVWAPVPEF